jgi:hypothetical protein
LQIRIYAYKLELEMDDDDDDDDILLEFTAILKFHFSQVKVMHHSHFSKRSNVPTHYYGLFSQFS